MSPHGRKEQFARLCWGAAAALCLLVAGAARTAETDEPSAERDLPPAVRRAIDLGVNYLVENQREDGSWGNKGRVGTYPGAMTALAGLALVAGGSLPESGPHAANVRRAVEYLLNHADAETGLIGGEESGRPLFGHGFAMLFLAQVYGSEGDLQLRQRIGRVLAKAVEFTRNAQSADGGWYYEPDKSQDEGAVTVTQMQGLRACADAGIAVPADVVKRGTDYIIRSANADGGIAYRASEPKTEDGVPDYVRPSRPPITCAAVVTLYSAGMYDSELAKKAFDYASRSVSPRGASVVGAGHYFYAHLYLSQAMYFRGGDDWRAYFPQVRDWLLSVQRPDGSWEGDFFGTTYGTAVALLILQLPDGALPSVQR